MSCQKTDALSNPGASYISKSMDIVMNTKWCHINREWLLRDRYISKNTNLCLVEMASYFSALETKFLTIV